VCVVAFVCRRDERRKITGITIMNLNLHG
jgi:hypothetical protein